LLISKLFVSLHCSSHTSSSRPTSATYPHTRPSHEGLYSVNCMSYITAIGLLPQCNIPMVIFDCGILKHINLLYNIALTSYSITAMKRQYDKDIFSLHMKEMDDKEQDTSFVV